LKRRTKGSAKKVFLASFQREGNIQKNLSTTFSYGGDEGGMKQKRRGREVKNKSNRRSC